MASPPEELGYMSKPLTVLGVFLVGVSLPALWLSREKVQARVSDLYVSSYQGYLGATTLSYNPSLAVQIVDRHCSWQHQTPASVRG